MDVPDARRDVDVQWFRVAIGGCDAFDPEFFVLKGQIGREGRSGLNRRFGHRSWGGFLDLVLGGEGGGSGAVHRSKDNKVEQ